MPTIANALRRELAATSRDLLERAGTAIACSDDRMAIARQLLVESRRAVNRERCLPEMWAAPLACDGAHTVAEDCAARIERAVALIGISGELIHVARTLVSSRRDVLNGEIVAP